MKRFGLALVGGLAGYAVAAAAGYWLTGLRSANVHDASVEAAMTSAFVFGPLGAIGGLVLGALLGARRSSGAGG